MSFQITIIYTIIEKSRILKLVQSIYVNLYNLNQGVYLSFVC